MTSPSAGRPDRGSPIRNIDPTDPDWLGREALAFTADADNAWHDGQSDVAAHTLAVAAVLAALAGAAAARPRTPAGDPPAPPAGRPAAARSRSTPGWTAPRVWEHRRPPTAATG